MKKFVGFALLGAMLLGGSMVYAGGACCAGKGDSAKSMGCSSDTLSKLNLTEDQQKKVDALVAECTKGKCTPEARANFTKAMKDILFDEKIFGSIHFTPGQCYDECNNGNRSAVHWDMVKLLEGDGEIWFDDLLIQKDGRFVPKDLLDLNPDHTP